MTSLVFKDGDKIVVKVGKSCTTYKYMYSQWEDYRCEGFRHYFKTLDGNFYNSFTDKELRDCDVTICR